MKEIRLQWWSLILCLTMGCCFSVRAAAKTYKLVKVTNVSAGGLYVFEQSGRVMNNTVSSDALQTTKTYESFLLSGTETYVWKLEKATNGFYMKNVSGNSYLYNSGTSTAVALNSKANKDYAWKFTFNSDGIATIQYASNNRYLGYTSKLAYNYKAYAESSLSNDTNPHSIVVYQLVEAATNTARICVNGEEVSAARYDEGASISFPSVPSDIEGKHFAGWATSVIDGSTDENPGLMDRAVMGDTDVTFYAVFADELPENKISAVFNPSDMSNTVSGSYNNDWFDSSTRIEMWLHTGTITTTSPKVFEVVKGTANYFGVESHLGPLLNVVVTLSNAANSIDRVEHGSLSTDGVTQTIDFSESIKVVRCYASAGNTISIVKVVVNAIRWTNYCTTVSHNRPVTISAAAKYAAYSATQPSDFSGTGVTVYAAHRSGSSVALSEVADGIVPANVGVILYKNVTGNETIAVPATTCGLTELEYNDLKASDGMVKGDGATIYALAMKTQGVGFYRVKNGVTIPAGKAYLEVVGVDTSREYLGFGDDVTGITSKGQDRGVHGMVYQLDGRPVSHMQRHGVYVINGQKVIK